MDTCKDCKCYFPTTGNSEKGDCIERVVDKKQAYFKAKPVNATQDVKSCQSFVKK